MYRQQNSTMTAVEIVSARYDGPIPADVMIEARAEDAAYRADPKRFWAKAALDGIAWNTENARRSISAIRQHLASGKPLAAKSERRQVLCAHLKARRQCQAQARAIMQGAVC